MLPLYAKVPRMSAAAEHCAGHYLESERENQLEQELNTLCQTLRELPEIAAKRSIQHAAQLSPQLTGLTLEQRYALPGDDCAAFKTGNGYQLLAMEGMLPAFVANDPKAAGWSSVMANVSDIAAMGGRPTAIVNAFWHHNDEGSKHILANIKRACDVFGVAFAGGHSSVQPHYTPGLAVAITGYATQLLSCHHLKPGQQLFMLSDLTGSWHGDLPYWGCVPGKTAQQVQKQWNIPAELAEQGLAVAAKDISNGGVLGTLIMMLELTGCGANVNLNAIPKPKGELIRWLRAFQSYGFLLAVEATKTAQLMAFFQDSHLSCQPIGSINNTSKITLNHNGASAEFWDLHTPLTGMGA